MNQELNKELTTLQEELSKIRSVSEILNNSKKSVADMAELSERVLSSFLELSPRLENLIDTEGRELTRIKEAYNDGILDLKSKFLEEISAQKDLVTNSLNNQISVTSQTILKLKSEVQFVGNQGVEEIKNFGNINHKETENLRNHILQEIQSANRILAEQIEKSQRENSVKIDELNEQLGTTIRNSMSSIIQKLEADYKNQVDLSIKQGKQIQLIKIVVFVIFGSVFVVLGKLFF